ncbi:MAG TPA: endonuclease/exonuclease/phosphatase family protein [Alphaproteobacteria bacterium]|nr:endonuclease/exonuclease/phosphatase family protein [Alphaproteobacteria bacterium]
MGAQGIQELTVVTYNVHSSVGRDRICNPDRILRVVAEINPDIIAFQEVSHRHIEGTDGDQFAYFRERTGMHAVAGLNLLYDRRRFGNALFSRWPITACRRIDLSVYGREPRGAIDADVDVHGHRLRIIATHLGLGPGERRRQVERLAHALHEGSELPTVILGDFNIFGRERKLLHRLGAPIARKDCPASFPARMPLLGLDRIWTRPGLLLHSLAAHRSALAAVASDHLPVVAKVALRLAAAAAVEELPRRRASA